MKICAIICEYNPFHNGHKYLIKQAKELSGCDAVLCLMSGSFTQRGEAAVLPKFTRAEHAVLGGADCVLQLPAIFSVAPAEIFAQGAVSILNSIPGVTHLAFGSENADEEEVEKAAQILYEMHFENAGRVSAFEEEFRKRTQGGESFKRALAQTMERFGAENTLITSPNGILAVEYTRAIKKSGAKIKILPVERVGSGYGDDRLKDDFSSAGAIRANLGDARVAENVPPYVYGSLKNLGTAYAGGRADALLRYCLLTAEKSDMTRIFGCTEGLENKLKGLAALPADEIVAAATSKRYTSSRIRRILAANMLGLYSDDAKRCLAEGTYIKPLAVRAAVKDKIFAELARSSLSVIIKKMSLSALSAPDKHRYDLPATAAEKCYRCDTRADFARALIYGERPEYDFTVKLI